MIRDAETNVVYVIDHHNLPRPIKDEHTLHYLKQVFGYQPDELIDLSPEDLQSLGPEVIALRDWKRPRTKEEDVSLDAQSAIQVIKKHIRTKRGSKFLSFEIRNNSKHGLQINLAELILDNDSPITFRDISPQNNPNSIGLVTCKLLFNENSESKMLSSGKETQLDLLFQRPLTASETSSITTVRLGYIKVTGVFRETKVVFHLYV